MIIDLRRDHEELKTMFWTKINANQQMNQNYAGLMENKDSSSEDSIILKSSDAKNRIKFKRPARLLPLGLMENKDSSSEDAIILKSSAAKKSN